MKDTFIFYKSWMDAIISIPENIQLEILHNIISYATEKKIGNLCPMAKLAFGFIKQDIDRMEFKQSNILERNKINGAKGGRPKKTQENPRKPKKTQEKANVDVDDNVNINEDIKETNKSSNEDIISKEKTAFEKYCIWIKAKMPDVAKLKIQMTEDNFNYLVSEFGKDNLIEVIEAMQNVKGITEKYTSVYLTARQWLKRRKQELNKLNSTTVKL